MARRKTNLTRTAVKTADSFQNVNAHLGLGAGSQQDGADFGFTRLTRFPQRLEAMYQGSWICSLSIDIKAEDMTREGVDLISTLDPGDVEKIEGEFIRLGTWDTLCDAIKWGDLYGGAIAVILIDGQNTATPLNPNSVARGQYKGMQIIDRNNVQPTLTDLITELGPELGLPKYYDVIQDSNGLKAQRIHHSRVIRFVGAELPYRQRLYEQLWGASILEKLYDRIVAFESATEGAAQLMFKAHLRTMKIKDFRQIVAAGGPALAGLTAQMKFIRDYQTNEGLTVMDTADEFETHAYSFAGLADMITQFGQQLSGAVQIPLVRLFGQSPAGLNSTGESDLKTYYDDISRKQNRKLRTGVHKLYDLVCRSVLGAGLPDGASIKFRNLYQLSAEQKANVAKSITESVLAAFESGAIERTTVLKELRQSSGATGIYSNISDEDIAEAENDPPPVLESANDPNAQSGQAAETQSGQDTSSGD